MSLKGQCHEIFDFCFFSWISFPQAPEYTNRAVSNFFENSRRYSQLRVNHRCRWHRWQMAKIFKLKKYRWCTLTCEYLREFSKKFETVLMQYSGAGGKLIHPKNQKQKISWHCPFKGIDQSFQLRGEIRLIRSAMTNWRLGNFFYLILNGLHHKISKKPIVAA